MPGNRQQIESIQRYHTHLHRLGRATSLEQTARVWITKYARLWRAHQSCTAAT